MRSSVSGAQFGLRALPFRPPGCARCWPLQAPTTRTYAGETIVRFESSSERRARPGEKTARALPWTRGQAASRPLRDRVESQAHTRSGADHGLAPLEGSSRGRRRGAGLGSALRWTPRGREEPGGELRRIAASTIRALLIVRRRRSTRGAPRRAPPGMRTDRVSPRAAVDGILDDRRPETVARRPPGGSSAGRSIARYGARSTGADDCNPPVNIRPDPDPCLYPGAAR